MLAHAGPDVLVTYERTGGFAGMRDRVTVWNSSAALVNGKRVTLEGGEMRGLRGALDRVVTTESSQVGCRVADHFTYTLTYRGHPATRCWLPDDWRAAVERLEALIRR